MARKSRKATLVAQSTALTLVMGAAFTPQIEDAEFEVLDTPATEAPRILEDLREERIVDAEIDRQIALHKSVVKPTYKIKYKARAIANGLKGKAAKRSNGDWLSRRMAELVLTSDAKLNVEALELVCAANGLEDIQTRWPNKNTGWEGRLRMTACLVLRKTVADAGYLVLPDGTELEAPEDFCRLNATR
jgi:hypothetical protein